jgi:hypothetical protein
MIFRYSYLLPEINFSIKNKPLVTAIKAMASGFLFVFHLVCKLQKCLLENSVPMLFISKFFNNVIF